MSGPIGHFRAAKGSRVQVGVTNVTAAEWTLTQKGDDLDTTTFESGGFDQGTIGIVSNDWDTRGNWDAQQNRLDDPPGFFPRDNLGQVKLYENVADNVFNLIPQSRVLSAQNSAAVRDLVKFQATCKSNGSGVVLATGSV